MKKSRTLNALATAGLMSGLLTTAMPSALEAQSTSYSSTDTSNKACKAPSAERAQSLFAKLKPESIQMYNKLDCEGKNLAMEMAEQSCKGKNTCKGKNSCKTETNSCAGLGTCAKTSKGPFKDKNVAVQIATKMMAEKRANSMR